MAQTGICQLLISSSVLSLHLIFMHWSYQTTLSRMSDEYVRPSPADETR